MDADSELNLYQHIELFPFVPIGGDDKAMKVNGGNRSNKNSMVQQKCSTGKKKKNNKNKAKQNQVQRNFTNQKQFTRPHRLSANELLFFSKNHDSKLLPSGMECPKDLKRMKNYIEKISKMEPIEKRELRSKLDARYLHKKANKSTDGLPEDDLNQVETQFCFDHLDGRCNSNAQCPRWHQMRHPRFFGVCKYYISGVCANGDLCQFMHDDYPCRFYYLDMAHPKKLDEDNCRFKHGGPLPKRLYRYFMKQIVIWVKEIFKDKPQQIDSMITSFLDKFKKKHAKLEEKYGVKDNDDISHVSSDAGFSLETVLSSNQIKALTERNITSPAQINQIPIDDLLDYGLSMDQIYKITINTCIENSQPQIPQIECKNLMEIGIDENEASILDGILNCSDDIDSGDSFNGFSELEINAAIGKSKLQQSKPQTFDAVTLPIDDVTPFVAPSTDDTNQPKIIETDDQKQNSDSDDSDNEFSLIINEDI